MTTLREAWAAGAEQLPGEDQPNTPDLTRGQQAWAQRYGEQAKWWENFVPTPETEPETPGPEEREPQWWEFMQPEKWSQIEQAQRRPHVPLQQPLTPKEAQRQLPREDPIMSPHQAILDSGMFGAPDIRDITQGIGQWWDRNVSNRISLTEEELEQQHREQRERGILAPIERAQAQYIDAAQAAFDGSITARDMWNFGVTGLDYLVQSSTAVPNKLLGDLYSTLRNRTDTVGLTTRAAEGIASGVVSDTLDLAAAEFERRVIAKAALAGRTTASGAPVWTPEGVTEELRRGLFKYSPGVSVGLSVLLRETQVLPEFGYGPSISEKVDSEWYPEDPDRAARVKQRLLEHGGRISHSWGQLAKTGELRQMAEELDAAQNDNEIEAILAKYEDPIAEAIGRTVTDPLNVVDLLGVTRKLGVTAKVVERSDDLAQVRGYRVFDDLDEAVTVAKHNDALKLQDTVGELENVVKNFDSELGAAADIAEDLEEVTGLRSRIGAFQDSLSEIAEAAETGDVSSVSRLRDELSDFRQSVAAAKSRRVTLDSGVEVPVRHFASRAEQNLLKLEAALDPMRHEELVEAIEAGKALGFDNAVEQISGRGRTAGSKAHLTADTTRAAVEATLTHSDDPREMARVLRNWDEASGTSQSLGGQVAGSVLSDIPEEKWPEILSEAQQAFKKAGPVEARQVYIDAISEATEAKVLARFDDPALIRKVERLNKTMKTMLSYPFLRMNALYPMYNAVDAVAHAFVEGGPRLAFEMASNTVMAGLRVGEKYDETRNLYVTRAAQKANEYFVGELGFKPGAVVKGFGGGLEVAGDASRMDPESLEAIQELERSLDTLEKVRRQASIGGRAAEIEQAGGATMFMHAHKQAISRLKRIGAGLLDIEQSNPALYSRLDEVGIAQDVRGLMEDPSLLRLDDMHGQLDALESRLIRAATEGESVGAAPIMHYARQVWSDDLIYHIQQDGELAERVAAIAAGDPASVRRAVRDVERYLDDTLDDMILAADELDAVDMGWGAYDIEQMKAQARGPMSPFADSPDLDRMMKSTDATNADIAYRLAGQRGEDPNRYFKGLSQREWQVAERSGSPDEMVAAIRADFEEKFGEGAWEKYTSRDEWEDLPRIRTREELVAEATQRGVEDAENMNKAGLLQALGYATEEQKLPDDELAYLAHEVLDELGRMAGQTNPWGDLSQLYYRMLPGARQAAKEELPLLREALNVRNFGNPKVNEDAYRELLLWVRSKKAEDTRVLMKGDELKAANAAQEARRRIFKYKQNPDLLRDSVQARERMAGRVGFDDEGRYLRAPRDHPNSVDAYTDLIEQVRSGIRQMEPQIMQDAGRVVEDIDRSVFDDLHAWVDGPYKEQLQGVHMAALLEAKARRAYTLLDYADRTQFDVLMTPFAPFHYWTTHNMANWTRRVLEHPNRYAAVFRLQEALKAIGRNQDIPQYLREAYSRLGLEEEDIREGEPSRLSEYIPLSPLEWMMDGQKNTIYAMPSPAAFPLESLPIYGETYIPYDWDEMNPAAKSYMFFKNSIGSNPLVDQSIVLLNNGILPALSAEGSPWQNNDLVRALSSKLQENLPKSDAVSSGGPIMPLTRQIRAWSLVAKPTIENLTGGHIEVPEEGWNIEGWLSDIGVGKYLGASRLSTNEQYWVHKELAFQVATGDVTSGQARQALLEKEGPVWNRAKEAALRRYSYRTVSRTASLGTAQVQLLPHGEMVVRGLRQIQRELKEDVENGVPGAREEMAQFAADHPELVLDNATFDVFDVKDPEVLEERNTLRFRHYDYTVKKAQARKLFEAVSTAIKATEPDDMLLQLERLDQWRDNKFRELAEEYGEDDDAFWDMVTKESKARKTRGNLNKAQSMRAWLDMFNEAQTKEERDAMLQALPTSMAAASMIAKRPGARPQINMTRDDIDKLFAKNLSPTDQVYSALEDVYGDRISQIQAPENEFIARHPQYTSEWFEYQAREWPEKDPYLEENPLFAAAVDEHRAFIDGLYEEKVSFTDREIGRILGLHPDWSQEERNEFVALARDFGNWNITEWAERTKSDRELSIKQIWNYYRNLPDNSLEKQQFKKWAGPNFEKNFLAGNYHNVSEGELSLWLRGIPSVYGYTNLFESEGIFSRMLDEDLEGEDIPSEVVSAIEQNLPEGMSGAPGTIRWQIAQTMAEKMMSGPSAEARAAFSESARDAVYQPGTTIALGTDEEIKSFSTEEELAFYEKRSLALLEGDGNTPYSSWDEVIRLDRGPEGAAKFATEQIRQAGSLSGAISGNEDKWFRIVAGLMHMPEEDLIDLIVAYPDIATTMAELEGTEGPTYNMFYELTGRDTPATPFEPPTQAEEGEYAEAYQMYQRAFNGNRELFDHPLVEKYFPPNSPSARFWNTWYALPKKVRSELYKNSELIEGIMNKAVRGYLDDQVYAVATEALTRQYSQYLDTEETPFTDKIEEALSSGKAGARDRETLAIGDSGGRWKSYGGGYPSGYGGGGSGYGGGGSGYGGGGRGGNSQMWNDFATLAGPLLIGELGEVFRGKRQLSDAAMVAIDKIRNQLAPGMETSEFIRLLRQLYFRYNRIKEPRPPWVRFLTQTGSFGGRQLSRGGRFFVRR